MPLTVGAWTKYSNPALNLEGWGVVVTPDPEDEQYMPEYTAWRGFVEGPVNDVQLGRALSGEPFFVLPGEGYFLLPTGLLSEESWTSPLV